MAFEDDIKGQNTQLYPIVVIQKDALVFFFFFVVSVVLQTIIERKVRRQSITGR